MLIVMLRIQRSLWHHVELEELAWRELERKELAFEQEFSIESIEISACNSGIWYSISGIPARLHRIHRKTRCF